MNGYEQLIGQSFNRLGTRFTIVKCHGATVVAAFLHNQKVRRMLVPLSEVLKSLDVPEVELTALPEQKAPKQKAKAGY